MYLEWVSITLQIRRHWSTFSGLETIFEINTLRLKKSLPKGAGYHITGPHDLVVQSRDYFDTPENWHYYSRQLCDQYCEYFVMEHPHEGNTFDMYHNAYINDRYAAQTTQRYLGDITARTNGS